MEMLDPLSEAVALLERGRARSGNTAYPRWQPELQLEESDRQLVIQVALPGVRRESIRVRVAEDLLTLEADRRVEGTRPAQRGFVRSFLLPVAVVPEAVDAMLHDGVLTVTVDKGRSLGSRRIPIS